MGFNPWKKVLTYGKGFQPMEKVFNPWIKIVTKST